MEAQSLSATSIAGGFLVFSMRKTGSTITESLTELSQGTVIRSQSCLGIVFKGFNSVQCPVSNGPVVACKDFNLRSHKRCDKSIVTFEIVEPTSIVTATIFEAWQLKPAINN